MSTIPLARPYISEDDAAAVTRVLESGSLSLGPAVPAFEQAFADIVGVKHAIAVNSGTSALHLCVRALNIQEGDEVITTPFSFIASANCILFEKATPVFVDIRPDTYCINVDDIEASITPSTKAILAVDVFGYMADWVKLESLAKKHNIALIEDSCEALGTECNGRQAGSYGDCAVFGFYPNKQMTTGEGGMVTTNRDDIAAYIRSARNQGRDPGGTFLAHQRLGYNYRLSDIHAALGSTQLAQLPKFIANRQQTVAWYAEELADMHDVLHVPCNQEDVHISWFVYVVRLADHFTKQQRDEAMTYLRDQGIGCNNYFPPIHLQPLYVEQGGYTPGMFPITEHIADRTIALPFFVGISRSDVTEVCATLQEYLASLS